MSQQNNAAEGSKPAASTAQAGPATTGAKADEAGAKKLPQLGALEDDDEFEDFPATAEASGNILDKLQKSDKNMGDQLWEDNWDDDDVEDDFTKQLRTAIAERNGAPDEAMKE
ncbi:DSS1/SEM1 family-domain-containing protein [Dioszegia hungarica]|uniref:26S proteasome complex subunit SEM1 n=1 Tax=Dioszegia hungarica TaxID=4972 RepID=A0AA38H714_9TREE|nr:DSS1/SEM1 family-domain-containing protein [Dioszegia hungarica]KAI9634806.1 DSS1/SEM1 family-domain-containing protein [Dioszegia hungarica]